MAKWPRIKPGDLCPKPILVRQKWKSTPNLFHVWEDYRELAQQLCRHTEGWMWMFLESREWDSSKERESAALSPERRGPVGRVSSWWPCQRGTGIWEYGSRPGELFNYCRFLARRFSPVPRFIKTVGPSSKTTFANCHQRGWLVELVMSAAWDLWTLPWWGPHFFWAVISWKGVIPSLHLPFWFQRHSI